MSLDISSLSRSNMLDNNPYETRAYQAQCDSNIRQSFDKKCIIIIHIMFDEIRTENPRVGGSIPPLATT